MENQNRYLPIVLVLVPALLFAIGLWVIPPNSLGVPGMLRGFTLKTANMAFSCDKQVEKGEQVFADETVDIHERAGLAREWFTMALSCNHRLARHYNGYFYLHGYGIRQDVGKGITYLKRSRDQGYSDSAGVLAIAYHNGELVSPNFEAATDHYIDCASDSGSSMQVECGAGLSRLLVLDVDPPRYREAYSWAASAAKSGNPQGKAVAAHLLYQGLGVEPDAVQARVWAESAAEQGEPLAYGTLAHIYLTGDGVPVDTQRGKAYLQKLEEVDMYWADRQLGYIYRDGVGELGKDSSKSINYFLSAAEKGDLKAASEVGKNLYESKGADGNFSEAFRWLTRASEEGDGMAMLYLSRLYFAGVPALSIAANKDKGWLYLNKAEKMGAVSAKADLAQLFYEGVVVTRSDKEAYRYAEEGAKAGDAQCQAWLGFFLQGGIGTSENEELAVTWLEKAASQDDRWAQFQLAETYFHGIGVPADREKAKPLLEETFKSGNIDAAVYLGYYFEHGLPEGEEIDLPRAHAYYGFAAKNGSIRGKEAQQRISAKLSADDVDSSANILTDLESSQL